MEKETERISHHLK